MPYFTITLLILKIETSNKNQIEGLFTTKKLAYNYICVKMHRKRVITQKLLNFKLLHNFVNIATKIFIFIKNHIKSP